MQLKASTQKGSISSSASVSRPTGNGLLDALPSEPFKRLSSHLEGVAFKVGEVVYETGMRLKHLYFPTRSYASLLYTTVDGATAEMGMVGNEGVIGIALFMGGGTAPNRAVVQSAGDALRLKADAMQAEFDRGGEFQRVLLRYTQALITQISQTAVCNRLHSVEQRLCRYLLMTRDRVQDNQLQMTHELIANMLGVRREGVTLAAQDLQDRGHISYARGHIKILDAAGLEAAACECYGVVRKEHDRLLGRPEQLARSIRR